jgi:hypothetical protein
MSTNHICIIKLVLHHQVPLLKHQLQKKQIECWTFLDLVMILGSACALILETNIQVSPIKLTMESKMVDNIRARNPISFEHMSC